MKYCRGVLEITVSSKFYCLLHICASLHLLAQAHDVFRNESPLAVGPEVGLLAMEATWRSVVWLMCAGVSVEYAGPIIMVNFSVLCSGDVRFEFHLAYRLF